VLNTNITFSINNSHKPPCQADFVFINKVFADQGLPFNIDEKSCFDDVT